MTIEDYQRTFGSQLKEFLSSPLGQTTILMLNGMKPNAEKHSEIHLHVANREKILGYEQCIRNFAALTFVPNIKKDAEPDYGIKEEKKPEPPKPYFVPEFNRENEVKMVNP